MIFNGINFPNHLIDSIRKGNLVIFAGAGASVDKPTSLPTFDKLAMKIAEDTGNTLKKNDSSEEWKMQTFRSMKRFALLISLGRILQKSTI